MGKEWEVRRGKEGVWTRQRREGGGEGMGGEKGKGRSVDQTEKRHSVLVTVLSRLGLQHQSGLCER